MDAFFYIYLEKGAEQQLDVHINDAVLRALFILFTILCAKRVVAMQIKFQLK